MRLSTKASLCSALFLALMVLPKGHACGSEAAYVPSTFIPMAILLSWPVIAGSLALSIPLSVWRESRARKKLVSLLREGVCINDTKHILRWARVQYLLFIFGLAAVSPFILGWTAAQLNPHAPELCSKLGTAYYEIAVVPEQIAEEWLGTPPPRRLNDITY